MIILFVCLLVCFHLDVQLKKTDKYTDSTVKVHLKNDP